jgi:hypothetical protein
VHRYADAYLSSCCSARDSSGAGEKRSKQGIEKRLEEAFAKTMF